MPTPERDYNDPAAAYIGNRRVPPYYRRDGKFAKCVSMDPNKPRIYFRYGWFCIRHLPTFADQPINVKGRTLTSVWNQYQATLKWQKAGRPLSRAQSHQRGLVSPTTSDRNRAQYLGAVLKTLTGAEVAQMPAYVPRPPTAPFHDPKGRLPKLPPNKPLD